MQRVVEMQERNIIGSATATVLSPIVDFYVGLAPFIILALVLIITDCVFGTKAAKARGEVIRKSRLLRRSINKLVDYICWITLAGMMGFAFGSSLHVPVLSYVLFAVVCAIELTSIFNNYFEYRGVHIHIDVFKFFARLLGRPEIEEAITVEEEEKKEE